MDETRPNLSAMQIEERCLLTERAQEINAIRQRDYLAIPSGKRDALGDLEQEIALAGEQFAAHNGKRRIETVDKATKVRQRFLK
jgi:hypothetical protein